MGFYVCKYNNEYANVFPQLDNPDEQAAQIRRELDGRLQMADQITRVRNKDDEMLVEIKNKGQKTLILHTSSHVLIINWLSFHLGQHGGRFPRFVSREMEAMYIEELRSSVNLLMANLESMPVSKGGEFKLQKLKRGHNTSIMDMGQEEENALSKSDVVLSFTLEVGGETCLSNVFAVTLFWYKQSRIHM